MANLFRVLRSNVVLEITHVPAHVEFSVYACVDLKFSWNPNCFCIWIIIQSVVDSCYPPAREQELENGSLQADGSSNENIFSSCKEETILFPEKAFADS